MWKGFAFPQTVWYNTKERMRKGGVIVQVPHAVQRVMERLQAAGFAAHVVGGCVRDSLLGLPPQDWDLTTDALPEQTAAVFAEYPVLKTGMRHGTVTVLYEGMPLEITTYRTDGLYHDHRRPDRVTFVSDITEDLRRRDLTINAMAWEPHSGLCDPFGGQADLKAGILRCVGRAEERLEEDALRILRVLRFASVYGFSVEPETAAALFHRAPLLCHVAAERVRAELDRLLTGDHVGEVLRRFHEVLYPVLPELRPLAGFDQHSRYHDKDVLEHVIAAVESSPPNLPVRLTLLLHDSGKPSCFTRSEDGEGHFYGHAAFSETIAVTVTERLRYDHRTQETVRLLVKYHDTPIADTDAAVRRWLNRLGEERLRLLWDVQEGDCRAHAAWTVPQRIAELNALRERLDRILAAGDCTSMKTLAVNGDDLLKAGIPEGRALGACLHDLLEAVIAGELPNERDGLLAKGLDYFAENRYNKMM